MKSDSITQADSPAILAGTDGSALQVPDGFDIFSAQFERAGDDLVIAADGGPPLTVVDYFTATSPPALVAPDGAMLTGDVVELLAGPRAPAQYAQAAAPEGASPIGTVEELTGSATALRATGEVVELAQGDPVFRGDVLATGNDSALGVKLEDGTLASMSSDSRLVLNEFVYEPDGSENWMLVNLVEGAFAFLTGAIAPSGGMEITTPVAVMAIRGTTPIALVAQNGVKFFAGTDEPFELLHLITGELLAVVRGGAGYSLSSPTAALETIDIGGEVQDKIEDLLEVLRDTAAELELDGVLAGSGYNPFAAFGNIDGNGATLFNFLALLADTLAEKAAIDDDEEKYEILAQLIAEPDQAVTEEMAPVTIDVLVNDKHPEDSDLTVIFAEVKSGPGTVTIVDGRYVVYDPGQAFRVLALGETATVLIAYTISDGLGATASTTVTVSIVGLNDGPKVSDVALAAVEDGPAVAASFAGDDVDSDDDQASLVYSVITPPGEGTVIIHGDGTFSFDPGNDFQDLAEGETRQVTFTYTATDSHGAVSDTATVTVTVTGTNDAPVVATKRTDDGGAVTELADGHANENSIDHVAAGTITFLDVDLSDTHQASAVADEPGYLGSFALGAVDQAARTVGWSFAIADADIDFLAANQTLTQTYTVTVDDGNGGTVEQVVTITITGANDAPVIVAATTDASGAVTELAGQSGSVHQHLVNGAIAFADVDLTDAHTASFAADGAGYLGSFVLGAVDPVTGTVGWTFTVIDSDIDHLAKDATLIQTYTVTIDDGNGGTVEQVVTITMTGTNDAPVIVVGDGDSAAADLIETNSGLQADGTLTVSDVSVSDVVTADVTKVVASGDHNTQIGNATLLGFLTVTSTVIGGTAADGTLVWDFDSGQQAFDFLADGEKLVLTYTVNVDDGTDTTSQAVTITIIGTNDAPVIDSIAQTNLNEQTGSGALQATISVDFGDVDLNDVGHTATVTAVTATGVTGGLTLTAAQLIALVTPGTASKAAGSADGSVDLGFSAASTVFDYLAAGEKATLTYTLRIGDGDGGFDWQTFVVVVTGTNDAPVISVNEGDSDEFSSSPNLATAAILSMNMDEGDPNYTPGETGIVVFNVSFDGGTTFEEILIEFEMGPSHVESVDNLIAAINAGDPRLQAENADLPYEFTLTALPDGSFAPIVASAEFTNTHTTESSEVGVEVVEAGTDGSGLAAAGTLTVRDVDVSDVVGATVVEVDVVGDTEIPTEDLLAMMSVDIDPVIVSGGTAGTISWEFDSGEEIFEFLAPGESLVLTYTIRATDTQGAFTEHQVTITIDNGDSVDGDLEAFASFDLLAFNGDTVEDDAESELFVLDDLSIHDVIADYQAGDVIDLTRLGFELATGELSQGTAEQFVRYDSSDGGLYVDVDGLGGPAEFVFAAQVLTAPQSILVRLTDGNTVVDAEFA